MTRRPVVEVDDLWIEATGPSGDVPGPPLVRGVSFTVSPGEMVGLAGESGSGKSLTASALASLLPEGTRQCAGTIRVNGSAGGWTSRADGVAMVFQNPMTSLNPSMRIGDQIAEAVHLQDRSVSRKAARAEAVALLSRVGVDRPEDRAKQYPFEFSGGMRQRAMIAIAVARRPKVLIADEPTTALDVTVQREVMDLIDGLREELGLAVLLISHDLAVVSERCDRLLVMYAGQLVETGPTRLVLGHPHHPYVSGLLRCIPERAMELGELKPLSGQVVAPTIEVPGCRFADRCPHVRGMCRAEPILLTDTEAARQVRCVRWRELATELQREQVETS